MKSKGRDTPKARKEEEQLKDHQYRLMIENQGEGIGLTDPDECFVFANPAAERIFGVAPGGLKGKNLKDFLSQEELARVTEETRKRSREEQSTYELEITTADNKVRIILVTATPQMNVEGEFTGTFGVFRDITDRKQMEVLLQQSEERYRTLTENIGEGVIIVNEDETFVYANPSAERIYGVSKGELTGVSVKDFLDDENLVLIKNQTQKRREQESSSYEHEIVLKDGTKKDILGTATPYFEGEKFIGTFGVFRDITERKKTESELRNLSEALTESNATKDKFFSIIAHDLKSPFNSILGLTDALIQDFKNLDEKRIDGLLNTIKNSSERAFELLENLLTWANSQTGRIEYTPEMINLRQTINETISLLEDQATSKYIHLSSPALEDCIAFCDKQMIQTVLRNLVSNAIKFTPPNGDVVIAITSTDHFYEISVKDTGIGIAKEDIPKLFRIESKYSTRGTADEKGTGLGLILCKEFVEKHGGKIWVESEEGKGSAFYFTLPLMKN